MMSYGTPFWTVKDSIFQQDRPSKCDQRRMLHGDQQSSNYLLWSELNSRIEALTCLFPPKTLNFFNFKKLRARNVLNPYQMTWIVKMRLYRTMLFDSGPKAPQRPDGFPGFCNTTSSIAFSPLFFDTNFFIASQEAASPIGEFSQRALISLSSTASSIFTSRRRAGFSLSLCPLYSPVHSLFFLIFFVSIFSRLIGSLPFLRRSENCQRCVLLTAPSQFSSRMGFFFAFFGCGAATFIDWTKRNDAKSTVENVSQSLSISDGTSPGPSPPPPSFGCTSRSTSSGRGGVGGT